MSDEIQTTEEQGIDPSIKDEARKQNSPAKRIVFLNQVLDRKFNQDNPRTTDIEKNIESAKQNMVDITSVKGLYNDLYGREISGDVPELEEQFNMIEQRTGNSSISEFEIDELLEKAGKFAATEEDLPQA